MNRSRLLFAVPVTTLLAACAARTAADPSPGGPVAATQEAPIVGSCACPGSPSGYACDPWSVHLLPHMGSERTGNTLRMHVMHDPDYEGAIDDQQIPADHDFFHDYVFDVDFPAAARAFACVVFSPTAGLPAIDVLGASFETTVDADPTWALLSGLDGAASAQHLAQTCGTSVLPTVRAPNVAIDGRPALAQTALLLPLSSNLKDIAVGAKVRGWLARGIVWRDEQAELPVQVEATLVSVQ